MTAVFNNAIMPFDLRNPKRVGGVAQVVLLEVIVSKMMRKILGMAPAGFMELAAIHAVSMPFLGGLSGFADAPGRPGGKRDYSAIFMDGAKGIPAVFLAQYIINTGARGIHVPGIRVKDILITAASKSLTRPLVEMVYPYLHGSIQDGFKEELQMERAQNAASNLKTARGYVG